MKRSLSIDWLQLHVAMPYLNYQTLVTSKKYSIVKQEAQTRNFKTLYTIIDSRTLDEVAVIAAEPRSEMCMKKDGALIKVTNKYLYQEFFSDFVADLLKELQLRFINITRLDLAYDFERFDSMECSDFINRFASRYYMKERQCKFKMMGDTWSVDKGEITGGISSLKFGLESSDVSYYLYNKTLELQQKKDKPWIREHWAENGHKGCTDVYRLEFSLHPDQSGIAVVNEHGEIERIHHFKDLNMLDNIQDVYEHYFNKHFNFVKTEKTKKGNYRKQSRCKPVELFKELTFEGVKISLSEKKDSGRSDKVFAKKLMQLNQELRGQDFDLAIVSNEAMTYVIKSRDLDAWAKKKLPDIVYSDRVVDVLNRGRNAKLSMCVSGMRDKPAIYPTQQQQETALVQVEQQIIIDHLPKIECKGCGHVVCECLF